MLLLVKFARSVVSERWDIIFYDGSIALDTPMGNCIFQHIIRPNVWRLGFITVPDIQLRLSVGSSPKDQVRTSTLQEKGCHESSIAELQRKLEELRHENDVLLEKLQAMTTTNSKKESLGGELTTVKQQLQDKDGVISSLKFELSCAAQSSRADLELEQDRNRALTERILYLEKTVSEVTQDRDDVEEANKQLHELVASLRSDNMDFRAKLDETEEKLEVVHEKMKNVIKENENKVVSLEGMLSKEMQKSQDFGEKLEYSLRQTEENFTKAQSTIVQLQEAKENLENKNHSLEAKLFELIEKKGPDICLWRTFHLRVDFTTVKVIMNRDWLLQMIK